MISRPAWDAQKELVSKTKSITIKLKIKCFFQVVGVASTPGKQPLFLSLYLFFRVLVFPCYYNYLVNLTSCWSLALLMLFFSCCETWWFQRAFVLHQKPEVLHYIFMTTVIMLSSPLPWGLHENWDSARATSSALVEYMVVSSKKLMCVHMSSHSEGCNTGCACHVCTGMEWLCTLQLGQTGLDFWLHGWVLWNCYLTLLTLLFLICIVLLLNFASWGSHASKA